MGEERAGRWKEGCGGKDRTEREGAGRAVVFLLLRTISHFTYEMNDNLGKNRMEAVLGSIGQDVRCFRPVRLRISYPCH